MHRGDIIMLCLAALAGLLKGDSDIYAKNNEHKKASTYRRLAHMFLLLSFAVAVITTYLQHK